ncbi:hypothetical protein EYF80_037819 [Liparis tanakae]|uniref:Uncharacterized protein n=1 Tax=Liparis tanakae TaxID=230148 RepID=A0A4Z2GF06_9TELE|nr:hypothetical protein EYF80_037819 [Liparis tanakae]
MRNVNAPPFSQLKNPPETSYLALLLSSNQIFFASLILLGGGECGRSSTHILQLLPLLVLLLDPLLPVGQELLLVALLLRQLLPVLLQRLGRKWRRNSRLSVHSPGTFTMELRETGGGVLRHDEA